MTWNKKAYEGEFGKLIFDSNLLLKEAADFTYGGNTVKEWELSNAIKRTERALAMLKKSYELIRGI